MDITEVRIKLMEDPGERLQAFCSITFDDAFVVRDLKIIDGGNGPFVAMPSRKLTSHCSNCGCKNYLRAAYCNQCGGRLKDDRTTKDEEGRTKLYADIAHPINSACREMIQERVIKAFHEEVERAKVPGYVSSYDDFDHEDAPPPRRDGRQASEQTLVQTAEQTTMRGPHKGPAHQAQGNSPGTPHTPPASSKQAPPRDSFGAGIF